MKRIISAIWLCCLGLSVFSQTTDTTLVLPEFEKTEIKFSQVNSLALVSVVDSATIHFNQAGTISDILESATTLFVRNYGPGYSVGVSQRGLSTAHTPIFWQGLNLNAPTTGIGDISLIPAAFIQSISISHGGASAATGSGALAGGIHLNPNGNVFNQSVLVNVGARYTSTQNLETSIGFRLNKNGWKVNTSIFNNDSQNRFNYVNHAHRDKPVEIRKNGAFYQKGWLQELEKEIGRHSLQFAFWGVETNRQLAPGLTSSDNQESQTDLNLKASLSAQLNFQKVSAKLQTAWLKDELNYSNASGIQSNVYVQQWVLNADFKHKISSTTSLNYGTNNSLQTALASGNYQGIEQQLALSVYAGVDRIFFQNRLLVHLIMRQESYQNFQNPFSPALVLNLKANNWLNIIARASRNYRIPGLNDRFWMPGGNPDLPAERAWVADLGPEIKLKGAKDNHEMAVRIFGFLHQIDNWIQWISGQDYWYAVSYKSVRSAGIQSEINWKLKLKAWQVNANVSHAYVNAKNLESTYNNQIEGLNLVHIPANKFIASFSVFRNATSILIDANYTSSRFISTDNFSEQPAFFLMNAGIGQRFQFKNFGANIKFRVHNILNADYQVMPWMPMPLRHYSIAVLFNFKSNIKLKT